MVVSWPGTVLPAGSRGAVRGARITATDPTMQQRAIEDMLDREAIRSLLSRFCRAIDRRDAELLATVYWDDAYEWHGAYRGPAAGFREMATKGPGGFEVMRHSLGTINI